MRVQIKALRDVGDGMPKSIIGVGTGGALGACAPPSFINCYINCSLLYV